MRWHKKSVTLLLSSCLLLSSGCSVNTAVNNEQRKDYVLDDQLLVCSTDIEGKSSNNEKNLIKDMEKVLENEYLELYLGTYYDIAVYDKITGKVTFSNPALYEMSNEERDKLQAESKRNLLSQVSIEYYNSSQKKSTMSSYPDSYSADKNQVTYEVKDDILTVNYGIGTSYTDTGLIRAFTQETFEHYDAILKEKMTNKEISIIDYRAFVNNHTRLEYTSMSAEDQKLYKERYPLIEELGVIYTIKEGLTNKITNQLLEMYTLLGIDENVKLAEEEKLGEIGGAGLPAYFMIPIKYQLHGSDLIVSVDTQDIVVTEGYYLTKVELLKCFGASKPEEEGYLFLPDGSGMIVENNMEAASMDKITIPFYGQDYGEHYESTAEIGINSNFPVFGIKCDDESIFAIVENGAAIGGVSAQTTSNYMNYNIAYPYFNYTKVDDFGINGVSYMFYGVAPDVEYTVRYHFLTEEEANYSGMARYYQRYLIQKGVLSESLEKQENLPLDIQFLGSIEKVVNYFGIPVDSAYPVTTFEQAEEIMLQLKDQGIENADVLYSGMINGGMKFKSVDRIKFQRELGGLNGFKKMDMQLEEMGYKVFTDIDFTRIFEQGNSIKDKEDVSKYLNRNTVYMGPIDPATGENMQHGRNISYLVNPLEYLDMGESFVKEFSKADSQRIYMSSIGAYLNGNYSTKRGVTRQTSQLLVESLLEYLKDSGYTMKFDCGNAYILPYASSLSNVATTSSHQRIESYSIPFVGMVLKGYVPYTGRAINQSSNREKSLLEAVESGAGLNYLLIYENQLNLVDTDYNDLVSVNYNLWLENIISDYKELNADLGYLTNTPIIKHEHLAEDVNCTIYEDGSKVYVNYSNNEYHTPDGTIEALSYLVKR